MTLDQAKAIKQEYKPYEGQQIASVGFKVWNVMIITKDTNITDMISACRLNFSADDMLAGQGDYEVYVVYRGSREDYTHETIEKFKAKRLDKENG